MTQINSPIPPDFNHAGDLQDPRIRPPVDLDLLGFVLWLAIPLTVLMLVFSRDDALKHLGTNPGDTKSPVFHSRYIENLR